MNRPSSRHSRPISNVGIIERSDGLFNLLSGSRARAPLRIWLEPRSLVWRYLTTNPRGYTCC